MKRPKDVTDKQWNLMEYLGSKAEKRGYKEARNKPNLFYKERGNAVLFFDLRTTDSDPYSCPRIKRSFYTKDTPPWMEVREYEEISELLGNQTTSKFSLELDGHCKSCEKDITSNRDWNVITSNFNPYRVKAPHKDQAKFLYCDSCLEEWKRVYDNLRSLPSRVVTYQCYLCERLFSNSSKLNEHHINYLPEETISVCNSCHTKIHQSDQYNHLIKQERPENFGQDYKLVPCSECEGKTLIPIEDYEEGKEEGVCSKCKKDKGKNKEEQESSATKLRDLSSRDVQNSFV